MVNPILIAIMLLSPAGFDTLVDVDADNPLHIIEVLGEEQKLFLRTIDESNLIDEYTAELERLQEKSSVRGMENAISRLERVQNRLRERNQEGKNLNNKGVDNALEALNTNQQRINRVQELVEDEELKGKLGSVLASQSELRERLREKQFKQVEEQVQVAKQSMDYSQKGGNGNGR